MITHKEILEIAVVIFSVGIWAGMLIYYSREAMRHRRIWRDRIRIADRYRKDGDGFSAENCTNWAKDHLFRYRIMATGAMIQIIVFPVATLISWKYF